MVSGPNRTPQHPELAIWQRVQQQGGGGGAGGGGAGGGRGGGGDEGGRGLLKAAWQVRKTDRFRSCVGSVRGPRGSVSPWVRCGSLRVRGVRGVNGVRAGEWGPCPIPDERQQHCHSSLSDRIFFFSISVGRLRTCGETQRGLAVCDFLFHVNRRAT